MGKSFSIWQEINFLNENPVICLGKGNFEIPDILITDETLVIYPFCKI